MRLSVITDEISEDLDTALGVCAELGIQTVELRRVDGAFVVAHDAASLGRIRAALAAGGFDCAVVDTPFLKTAAPLAEWDVLERGFEVAATLGARTVRVFSGLRDGDVDAARAWAAEILAEAVDRARRAGMGIALEIEHVCTVATGAEARRLLDLLPGDGLPLVWDPGNEARFTGATPDPAGYAAVRDRIAHVHVKDVGTDGAWTRVGAGLVDWGLELRRLAADGYDGLLALETHYALDEGGLPAATRECAAALRAVAAHEGVELR